MKMKWKEQINEKLEEIRTASFYQIYIEQLLDLYEEDEKNPVPPLSYADFMTFAKTGSRLPSEKPYFYQRRRLGYLTMLALLYPEDSKYIDELCETIWSVCSEVSWVIAPHLHCHLTEHKSQIDLFAAETGLDLSEIRWLLEERLPENIKDLIHTEVSLRIFDTMENTESWWENLYSNWASVCGGCVGMSYMYLAPERFERVKPRILAAMEHYLQGIGEDGGCSEGIDYWYYGFSFYLYFAEMLYQFTDEKEDIRHLPKVEKLAEFQQHIILRDHTLVSFSDAEREMPFVQIGLYNYLKKNYPNVRIPGMDCHERENKANLYGQNHAMTRSKPSWLFRNMLCSDANLKVDDKITEDTYYYENLQWYICRRKNYSFAAKAGHNQEEHNHNDVGSFIFATDKGQILCDIGVMEYTREAFLPETAYTIFNRSSLGHSVPILDGKAQEGGKQYRAENVTATDEIFKMDIQKAYETDMERITRKFEMKENGILLEDEYVFHKKCDIVERFISVFRPEKTENGVKIGDVILKTDSEAVLGSVIQNDHYGDPQTIYTIDYTVLENSFRIRIEKVEVQDEV